MHLPTLARRGIEVVAYDPHWPQRFEVLRARLRQALGEALQIEHVGSTAVPGLAAKPIIDLDVVVPCSRELAPTIRRLGALGYLHLGDQGVSGREAFNAPAELPAHHLYLCVVGAVALENHLRVRDYLRADAAMAARYASLKRELARRFAGDSARYCAAKTAFLVQVLQAAGMDERALETVRLANRRP